ncbi:DUF2628 domain-containing protein [Thalassoglobus sp.]|uniref:DUF2628 domain-containing protein n=1 Tax=Thalassoglobus sp. TaxID=2795869 RepID=UPI003AA8D05E
MVDDFSTDSENPFAAPTSASIQDSEPQEDSSVKKDLRAFVGNKWAYYYKQWESVLEGRDQKTGFNFVAFLFSGIWLPYRKMYFITFLFYGFIILETVLQEIILLKVLNRPDISEILDRVIGLGTSIVIGMYANTWYLSHSRKEVDKIRSEHDDDETVRRLLQKRGGTSLLSGFGMFFLVIIAMIAALVIISPEDF